MENARKLTDCCQDVAGDESGDFRAFSMIGFRESRTKNDGTGGVYLDGVVLGANYRIKFRFYRENPETSEKKTSTRPVSYPR